MKNLRTKHGLALLAALCAAALIIALPTAAFGKTLESAKAENIFFYAKDTEGAAVLIRILTAAELSEISHGVLSDITAGADTGKNYSISSTDNYPTTQYCEARGITVPELVAYAKRATSAPNAENLGFSGGDRIHLMATDSYGNYNRSWTYDELYGVPRYYFEGLYDAERGWNTGWEIAGEDAAKFGVTLEAYNEKHRADDPYYEDKRAVFAGGERTVPILATESFSGRTTSDTLVVSTEPGIASYIAKNGGVVKGSLADALDNIWSLRLSLPMTEADLMAARRTAYDNFKWIYNLLLEQERPAVYALGTVEAPVARASVSGGVLTISISCATEGARIYYAFDGAPQTPYTAPITVDTAGRDLAADPVTFYMTAVKEGYADAGILTEKYPGLSPAFKTLYGGMIGDDVALEAAEGVSDADFSAWADALGFVTVKTPSAGGYTRVDADKYRADAAAKTVTFSGDLFSETGSHSLVFHATGYADRILAFTVKKPAPRVSATENPTLGRGLVFDIGDADYANGLTAHIRPAGGESAMIPSSYLDKSVPGKIILKASYFFAPSSPAREAGSYTFGFVNGRFEPGTVETEAELVASAPFPAFDDVKEGDWYYAAVCYAVSGGLADAKDGTSFGAGEPMTRAMLVTALRRLEAPPGRANENGEGAKVFTDIPEGGELARAAAWAAEAGVVNGVGDGRFAPEAGVTREQFAAMIYRYAVHTGVDVGSEEDGLGAFGDAAKVSAYAREAIAWAVGAKILNGRPGGELDPKGPCTRAEAAQMLLNFGR